MINYQVSDIDKFRFGITTAKVYISDNSDIDALLDQVKLDNVELLIIKSSHKVPRANCSMAES